MSFRVCVCFPRLWTWLVVQKGTIYSVQILQYSAIRMWDIMLHLWTKSPNCRPSHSEHFAIGCLFFCPSVQLSVFQSLRACVFFCPSVCLIVFVCQSASALRCQGHCRDLCTLATSGNSTIGTCSSTSFLRLIWILSCPQAVSYMGTPPFTTSSFAWIRLDLSHR